ncbi:MAG: hypothetical protein PHY55_04230 [Bacteroidales bacterium]|nr:hypothetical protein [Bacteroidales bacterium]
MAEYTDEQIQELITTEKSKWENEILKPLQEDLKQYKPKEKTDTEKTLEQKEKELFEKEINLTLKEHGLQEFAGFFNVSNADELNKQIEDFKKVLKTRDEKNNFVPGDHQKNKDAYSIAEKNKDVSGMISAKLSNLFK